MRRFSWRLPMYVSSLVSIEAEGNIRQCDTLESLLRELPDLKLA
jgi:hypothetical protein